MLLGAVRFLENSLSRRPLTTNCILYGSLSGLAEFSQQTVIKVIILKKTKNTFLVFKLLNIAFVDSVLPKNYKDVKQTLEKGNGTKPKLRNQAKVSYAEEDVHKSKKTKSKDTSCLRPLSECGICPFKTEKKSLLKMHMKRKHTVTKIDHAASQSPSPDTPTNTTSSRNK